jgi:hypothetical protein
VYRLGTTWLNPRTASATELLVLYHERWEIRQIYKKYKPKKRDVPPSKPFEPGKRFEECVVIVVRPQGSKLLAEATPLIPI